MEVDDGWCERSFVRTLDEVSTVIEHAKLEESDLKSVSQVISFSPHLIGPEMRLIQVSKSLLETIKAGDKLTFRGEDEESVVICSNNKTFDVKDAETSNSLLILPELSLAQDIDENGERSLATRNVSGIFYKYLELQEIRPRLSKLRAELQNNILEESCVRDGTNAGVLYSRLLAIIQASEEELKEGLKTMEAIQFKDKWFILEQNYQIKILTFLMRFFDENSWSLDCVKKQESLESLNDLVDPEILPQVFDMYCTPMPGGTEDEFSVDKDKVCRFYGDCLLFPGTNLIVDEFLDMWQKAVPENLQTSIDQLAGLVLVDTESNPHKIRRFVETDLPINIQDRLEELFSTRARWSLVDISPFIEPLTTPKLNVNALLTKYAKPVNSNGKKYFCAKHGK